MNIRNDPWHLALATVTLALAPAFSTAARPAVAPQVAAINPVASVDPRVPRAAGNPCVVPLLQNRPWPQERGEVVDPHIVYTPPLACPPPWSKVILKLDVHSSQRSMFDSLGMDLARVRLFRGGPPRYDGEWSWHVERDLTDYSALFRSPHAGRIWSAEDPTAYWQGGLTHASAQLFFYSSTAATPAPRVPDAVIAVNQNTPVNLPHNIVRAYLDVENAFVSPIYDQIWFTCLSNDSPEPLDNVFAPGTFPRFGIMQEPQGCGGGTYRELQATVDGTLAGIAPAFPRVIADLNPNWELFRNGADLPIPTLEMLNAKPYRIDLSPFAAILSAAGPHSVSTTNPPLYNSEGRPGGATLLLYLDPHRALVTGAVTLNTLATENGAPTDVNTLTRQGDTTQGSIKTRQHRDFTIRGFVNTSAGRLDSSVQQTDEFTTLQNFLVEAPDYSDGYPVHWRYFQDVWLTSETVQTSRRARGDQLLSWDRETTSYPLQLTWHVDSTIQLLEALDATFHHTNITVLQRRVVDGDHYKPGFGFFRSHAGARFYSTRKGGDQEIDPRWQSYTTRNYTDNFGSCYHGEMASWNGAIVSRSLGGTCPDGINKVRWFAHPDGSPDTLGWWH